MAPRQRWASDAARLLNAYEGAVQSGSFWLIAEGLADPSRAEILKRIRAPKAKERLENIIAALEAAKASGQLLPKDQPTPHPLWTMDNLRGALSWYETPEGLRQLAHSALARDTQRRLMAFTERLRSDGGDHRPKGRCSGSDDVSDNCRSMAASTSLSVA